MTLLRDRVLGTDIEHESVTLVVAWRSRQTLAAGWINLSRDVDTYMRQVCRVTLDDLSQRHWRPDDPEVGLADDECLELGRAALWPPPPVLGVLDHTAALDELSARTLPGRSLLFYAVVVGRPPDHYTAFLRKINPYVSMKSGRFFSALGDHLARIEEPVFAFDDAVDLVVTGDGVVALSMGVYELLFRETEALTERIPVYVAKIGASLQLDSEAARTLEALAAKSSRLRNKLHALSERDYLQRVTVDHVHTYMESQGMDPGRLIRGGRLVLDEADPHLLVQVLNEDLYTGQLSGNDYAVDRKSAVRTPHVTGSQP